MSFKMACPHCQKALSVNEKALGRTVPCPSCHQPIAIPAEAPQPLTRPPTVPPTPPSGAKPSAPPPRVPEPPIVPGAMTVPVVPGVPRPWPPGMPPIPPDRDQTSALPEAGIPGKRRGIPGSRVFGVGKNMKPWVWRSLVGGLILVAVLGVVVLSHVATSPQASSGVGTSPAVPNVPGLDLGDLERTKSWAASETSALAQLEKSGNALRLDDAKNQLQQTFSGCVGKEVSWQFPVVSVTRDNVVLQNRWTLETRMLSMSSPLFLVTCRQDKPRESTFSIGPSVPDLTLAIGTEIARPEAASLSSGDRVTLRAPIEKVELSSGSILVSLGSPVYKGLTRVPAQRASPRSTPETFPSADAGPGACLAGCGGCGALVAFVVGLIVVNILLLVWVARDAKARGMSSIGWLFLIFFFGLIGLIIYIFARPRGAVVPCATCGNKRLQVSAVCPHCGNR